MKKSEFKQMLKECIAEMVAEGKISMNGEDTSSSSPALQEQVQVGKKHSSEGNPTITGTKGNVTANSRLNEAVANTVSQIAHGDPKKAKLYESVIMDTARTTLQKKLQAENGQVGMMSEGAATPDEKEFDKAQLGVFAASNRWAGVAFGNAKALGVKNKG